MSSSFLFNGKNTISILSALIVFGAVELLVTEGLAWLYIVPNGLGLIVIFLYWQQSKKEIYLVSSLFHLAKHVEAGKLEYRITNIPPEAELAPIAWNFNSALDQIETYIREVTNCFLAAEKARFYRKPQPLGINGAFATNLRFIDTSLQMMRENYFTNLREALFSQLGQMKTENLLSSLLRTEEDLSAITQQMRQVETITKDASNIAAESTIALGAVIEKLSSIIEKIELLKSSSLDLSQSSKEITNVTSLIAKIADQTNLLALNAAIEAARAGDHGRGFSVVADEVRKLAENTKNATTQINSMIIKFTKATSAIVEDTGSMARMTDESKIAISEFERNIKQVSSSSMETYGKVAYAQMIGEVALVKVNQMTYVQQGYRAVELGVDSPAAKAVCVSHHDCKLGRWYHQGIGAQQYGHLPSYRKIDSVHQITHQSMNLVMQHLGEGWQTSTFIQSQILDNFRAVECSSMEVVRLLEEVVREKQMYELNTFDQEGDIQLF